MPTWRGRECAAVGEGVIWGALGRSNWARRRAGQYHAACFARKQPHAYHVIQVAKTLRLAACWRVTRVATHLACNRQPPPCYTGRVNPRIVVLAILLGACGTSPGDGDPDSGKCLPAANTVWVTEGETARLTLACAGEMPDPSTISLRNLPAGANWDPATYTLTWTTDLDDAAVVDVELQIGNDLATAETAKWTIGVADAFGVANNAPLANPAAYRAEFGIPVVTLDHEPVTNEYEPVQVTYGNRQYAIAAKLRGATSLAYPKHSFTLDFTGDKLTDATNRLVNKKKIVLTTTFDDNSYLRVRLAWEVWNRLNPTVKVIAFPVVVYINRRFHGVYVLSDHIDDELMNDFGLPEDGNLYKAIDHNANFMMTRHTGAAKITLHEGYEKQHGEPPADFSDLDAFVSFVANSSPTVFAAEFAQRAALADYQAWWIFAVFTRADDSAGKNSYHHHSATTPWHVVPWDFNASFGQSWETSREEAGVSDYRRFNRIFDRFLSDPALAAPLRARLRTAIAGELSPQALAALCEQWATELAPVVKRDDQQWSAAYRAFFSTRTDFTTVTQEQGYVKRWLGEQAQALLAAYPQ